MQDIPAQPIEPAANLEQHVRREGVGISRGEVLAPIQRETAKSGHIAVGVRVEGAGVA